MHSSCCYAASRLARPLLSALALSFAVVGVAQAATFGHARLLSAQAQPFQLQVPLRQLTQQDTQTLQVGIPPLAQWQAAGLAPPVALSSLAVTILPGPDAATRLLQISSPQAFHGNSADLLLEVNTASGQLPYQVSVLAARPLDVSAPLASQPTPVASTDQPSAGSASSLKVKTGDTLWRIAQRHAVAGTSIHQLMFALFQANPGAFINGNINQLKAGAQLQLPDAAAVQAVSRRQALRFFEQQMQAWQQGRTGGVASASSSNLKAPENDSGAVQANNASATPPAQASTTSGNTVSPSSLSRDQLVLSSASADALHGKAAIAATEADMAVATQKNIAEADERISQLERNVKSVNEALQSQGQAATEAVLEGARSLGQSLAELTGGSPHDSGTAADADSSATSNGISSTHSTSDQTSGMAPTQSAAESTPESPVAAASGASGSDAATAATATTGADSTAAAQAGNGAGQAQPEAFSTPTQTGQSGNWVQNNLLALVSAILALIVLIVVWVLRRANVNSKQPPITEAMVQEQLDKINLDLSQTGSSLNPPDSKS